MYLKFSFINKNLGSSIALAKASSSWSKAMSFPLCPSLLRISLECPPPPKVTSTYTPSGLMFSPSTDSFNNTGRSEEHTSELQSRENLVCRLLLEKKKKHI